jgi:enamine deaminase RidA (YjgF/YER057c/UK114 family)
MAVSKQPSRKAEHWQTYLKFGIWLTASNPSHNKYFSHHFKITEHQTMTIIRHHTNSRMSKIVIHNETIYLSGQVAQDRDSDIATQTQQVLDKIEALLKEAGSNKNNILSAQIWLSNIANFSAMNQVWDKWIDEGNQPARATIEARLASPELLVEIGIIAAQ